MGISREYWLDRLSERTDLASSIVHLTKPTENMDCLQVLIKILKDKKLVGSSNSGFIQGSERAVCFQDAPISAVAQNVRYEEKLFNEGLTKKSRYYAFGLSFSKASAFRKGARPVIYEEKETAKQKFKDEIWRVVSLNLYDDNNYIDWTHEREWRVKGDFNFELEEVLVILPNSYEYQRFINCVDAETLSRISGIIVTGLLVF